MQQCFLKDKVLEIVLPEHDSSVSSVEYQYVTISIKTLSKREATPQREAEIPFLMTDNNLAQDEFGKVLCQIVDVSHKMLYTDVKAEQKFLTLINATVSHELRNPLNSLIGQTVMLDFFMDQIRELTSKFKVGQVIT